MEDSKKLYEITKTIRFELKPQNDLAKNLKNILEENKEIDIINFLDQLKDIQKFFLDIFILNSKEDNSEYLNLKFVKNREIKYSWLRSYLKSDFYDWREKAGKNEKEYKLSEVNFLEREFLRWLNEWQELIDKLEYFIHRNEHEQKRRSEIAFIIRHFLKRQNFEFIREFVKSIKDLQGADGIESDEKLQSLHDLLKNAQNNLKACEQEYLPSQSSGIILHKASLNYYILNKTPKEYRDLREEKERELETVYELENSELEKLIECKFKNVEKFTNSKGKKENKFGEDFSKREIKNMSLNDLYKNIKNWKALEKSKFNESVRIGGYVEFYEEKKVIESQNIKNISIEEAKGETFNGFGALGDFLGVERTERITHKQDYIMLGEYIKKYFPIFESQEKDVKEFLQLSNEVKDLGEKKNELLQIKRLKEKDKAVFEITNKIDRKRKEMGKFFNSPVPKKVIRTKNYEDICECYKGIAIKRGKIIAEIKSLENEEVQSQLLDHWAVILKEDKKHLVAMIPRGKHKKAHDFINSNFDKENVDGEVVVYHFKSLTLRALEKLCFKESDDSFKRDVLKTDSRIRFSQYKEEWRKQEWKIIKFYKEILKSNYAKKYLDLVDFGGLENFLKTEFDNLEEFESELEKVCYVKIPLKISIKQKDDFVEKFDVKVFEMTTQSISKESKRKENAHAKIWIDFWSPENEEKNHVTRLNPEMSVFYREALDKRTKFENRYSEERFTLATTITLNATNKKSDLAFKTTQDIKDHIDEFNENYNVGGEWIYGIDRGLKELATLNVVKFSCDKNEFGVYEPKEFAKIEVWKIKDLNKSKVFIQEDGYEVLRIIGNNPSYFFTDDGFPDSKFFKKEEVSSIDLTQAKLIKGHIILNGDSKTYLKLKELSAKRRIFELFSTSRIDKDSKFSFGKTIVISGIKFRYPIYWLTEEQKNNQEQKKQLEKLLKEYLQELDKKNKFEDIKKIEKINHLRDAITANMVGIIAHLQKEKKGFIALENLDTKKSEMEKRLNNDGEKDKDLETGRMVSMIDEHFDQSNQDISRRLEWALYRKFANTGDVPLQIKQSIILRDDFEVDQMGVIKFVKVGGTSSNCPNCEKPSGKTNGHFVCKAKDNDCNTISNKPLNIF